jgi:hypothetical protein
LGLPLVELKVPGIILYGYVGLAGYVNPVKGLVIGLPKGRITVLQSPGGEGVLVDDVLDGLVDEMNEEDEDDRVLVLKLDDGAEDEDEAINVIVVKLRDIVVDSDEVALNMLESRDNEDDGMFVVKLGSKDGDSDVVMTDKLEDIEEEESDGVFALVLTLDDTDEEEDNGRFRLDDTDEEDRSMLVLKLDD